MTELTAVLLIIALIYLIAALVGFADGMLRLVTAITELATKLIAIYFDR